VEGVYGVIPATRSVAATYDAIAVDYEAQLAQNPVAQYMRTRLHHHFTCAFRAGNRVLDLTAGTGVDASFLASLGIRVIAMDVSVGMTQELERKAERGFLSIETHVSPVEDLAKLGLSNLDGAISTFGGLNTVYRMPGLAADLASCLKPRGRVILHALNHFCFWQTIRSAAHGRPHLARATDIHVGPALISHRFYDPFLLWRDVFARDFALREVYALSVVAAPPLVKRFPRAASTLFALDRLTGRLFPGAGDFFVLDLEKRCG
jgi:SAM-dependent methyltransferase